MPTPFLTLAWQAALFSFCRVLLFSSSNKNFRWDETPTVLSTRQCIDFSHADQYKFITAGLASFPYIQVEGTRACSVPLAPQIKSPNHGISFHNSGFRDYCAFLVQSFDFSPGNQQASARGTLPPTYDEPSGDQKARSHGA
ncbi:hypothetical protein K503DRAFT_389380 [Rhizopogon vinicolor AM-OR11-026]|uniref:Secreted protein n=1 Tax=Rhizopogon vinicolor AM-OR11-026 TaxID=1314800 RepID=A0A1B7NBI9_9AGAM|nr:hypothetical protein K503DRAFT_389380 [Rhizopogon vinicolor AM-OR11-026]